MTDFACSANRASCGCELWYMLASEPRYLSWIPTGAEELHKTCVLKLAVRINDPQSGMMVGLVVYRCLILGQVEAEFHTRS